MKYNVVIAHRVSPCLSKTAVGFSSKFELVRTCSNTLKAAIGKISGMVKLYVILDGCDKEYEELYNRLFSHSENVEMALIKTASIGNFATYEKQIQVLKNNLDTDYLYFSEDDYLYLENAFTEMIEMMRTGADFVSPLDHPDNYNTLYSNAQVERLVHIAGTTHWQTVDSTCLTFMCDPKTFMSALPILRSYSSGIPDTLMWFGLTKRCVRTPRLFTYLVKHLLRIKLSKRELLSLWTLKALRSKCFFTKRYLLWSPIPTLAIHLSSESLPPLSDKVLEMIPDEARLIIHNIANRYLSE